MRKLFIEEHKEYEESEPKDIKYENLGYFYDRKHSVGVYKKRINQELQVGTIYDFTFEDSNDVDTYCYIILKKEKDIYYITECYNNELYHLKENYIGDVWVKCDIKIEFGIDIDEWERKLNGQRRSFRKIT